MASEKVVITFPIELESSAHQGGSLAWDKDKNLFISTGDNTVPFESDGYNPIDERPGRLTFDAQRSAGNANDLRGKVLRIHPEADGSYTIPKGNLFPEGTAGTRPEIYAMGLRNPYRIAVDKATSILYWGEIGPDAGEDGKQGPRGYDEFNQAKSAGNFGWPYFIGKTYVYNDYNFETKTVGAPFDKAAPLNDSPNNTGVKTLPPPQSPMIWYPYNKSEEFPELGLGGRSAIAGAFYHFDPDLKSQVKIPEFYDNSLFIMDWMRNWVFAVRFDENNNFKRLDPFMPNIGDFRRPIDLDFGPDGAIYMLEYGSVYGIDNDDARLVKIEYNPGNRVPVAKITTKDTIGLAPFTVTAGSWNSMDADEEDKLTYQWYFDGKTEGSSQPFTKHTYEKNGIYNLVLKVTDPSGASSTDTVEIKVGNTLPQVAINLSDNKTFFGPQSRTIKYAVDVKDNEDKVIDKKKVKVSLNYIPKVSSNEAVLGHQQLSDFNLGKSIIAGSDCKACHQMDKKSVGPAFMEISRRYRGEKNEIPRLANKIITGGGGVWGDHAMNAHPQLSYEETTEIVKYLYSLSEKKPDVSLPPSGSVTLKEHVGKEQVGRYVLTASYTDKGGAITPLSTTETVVLRPSKVVAKEADLLNNVERQGKSLGGFHNGSYFKFSDIDLSGISKVTYRYFSIQGGATLEVHKDSPRGEILSAVTLDSTGEGWNKFTEVSAPIKDPGGVHSLYFVLKKADETKKHLLSLETITFE
jgi:cytochrome c